MIVALPGLFSYLLFADSFTMPEDVHAILEVFQMLIS